jgi:hypothetical protein
MNKWSRRGFWAPEGMVPLAIGALMVGITLPAVAKMARSLSGGGFWAWAVFVVLCLALLMGVGACVWGLRDMSRSNATKGPGK